MNKLTIFISALLTYQAVATCPTINEEWAANECAQFSHNGTSVPAVNGLTFATSTTNNVTSYTIAGQGPCVADGTSVCSIQGVNTTTSCNNDGNIEQFNTTPNSSDKMLMVPFNNSQGLTIMSLKMVGTEYYTDWWITCNH